MKNKTNDRVSELLDEYRYKKTKILRIMFLNILLANSASSEVLKMKNEPIKTRISCKHLNRISVKNDRIESVSGLDVAFHFEKNEKTGDGYIKPTEENGKEPIAISLTTVSGRTQELVLNIDDGGPNVLILEPNLKEEELEDFSKDDFVSDSIGDRSNVTTAASEYEASVAFETSVVEAMKRLIAGANIAGGSNILPIRLSAKPSRIVPGFRIKFIEGFKVGGFIGQKFEVKNDSSVMIDLKESDFLEEGDIALSFSDLDISKGKTVFLYVLARA
jgi:hypothetical protein